MEYLIKNNQKTQKNNIFHLLVKKKVDKLRKIGYSIFQQQIINIY